MNPTEMIPRLNAIFGPDNWELVELLVQLAMQHKVSGERCIHMPSSIYVILLEAACK